MVSPGCKVTAPLADLQLNAQAKARAARRWQLLAFIRCEGRCLENVQIASVSAPSLGEPQKMTSQSFMMCSNWLTTNIGGSATRPPPFLRSRTAAKRRADYNRDPDSKSGFATAHG